jgi:hypothetical protein
VDLAFFIVSFPVFGNKKAGDLFSISCYVMPRVCGGYLVFCLNIASYKQELVAP